MLRFVTPLVCRNDSLIEQTTYEVAEKSPNVATFIVGVIAAAAGGVSLLVGLADDDPGGAPATYLGAIGLIGGSPFVIGPFIGNDTQRTLIRTEMVPRGAKDLPCGDRAVIASAAMIRRGETQIIGTVSKDGVFSVSPFTFIDAFALHRNRGLDLQVELFHKDASTRIEVTLSATDLAVGRDGYLKGLGVRSEVQPLHKVPGLEAVDISVTRMTTDGRPALEIAVRIENRGPGDAWGVRAVLQSRNRSIAGRILYVGHITAKSVAFPRIVIQMSSNSVDLADSEIAVGLRDAHRTAPSMPLRFKGPILNRQ